MPAPESLPSIPVYDVVILGNGTAAAGAILRFKEALRREPGRPLSVLVLEAKTAAALDARIPEYNARVTFPEDLPGGLDLSSVILSHYERVAYYSHGEPVKKQLPHGRVALVDTDGLIRLAEADLPPQIELHHQRQAFDVRYVSTPGGELVEVAYQHPFGDEKVFETTGRVRARAVIDCAGTASLVVDKLQGYRNDSSIVCGVLAFKVVGAQVSDTREVSLGLDDSVTHGAGSWAYPNEGLSPRLEAHLDAWFATTTNPRIRALTQGKHARDFAGTIVDVGISSIAPYARAQHYQGNLERQADALFQEIGGYRAMFQGAAVVPGSAFFKPSPVLQPVAQMAGRRYLLAGDAAGHATPYIGEGVRPGMEMGFVAADIILEALRTGDFSEATFEARYEQEWWSRYGHTDVWSDLFRHYSSTCFSDEEWKKFLARLATLTDDEFYRVLRSEYDVGIVAKMFPYELMPHYLKYQAGTVLDFVLKRTSLRQAASWIR